MTLRSLAGLVLLGAAAAACRPSTRPSPAAPGDVDRVSVIPAPLSLSVGSGAPFALVDSTPIMVDAPTDDAMRIGEMLGALLRPSTGFTIPVTSGSSAMRRAIYLRVDPTRADGDEGYALTVTADAVRLDARTPAGLFYGVQTIRQLLPAGIESDMANKRDWSIPAVTITDRPRFAWRGGMLDVSRHFFTVDEVKQYIDLLALYKFNIFHIHLTDDQGWRIEIKSRPALTAAGNTQVGAGPGGFYTQVEYAELVRYAADRFLTVVPEVDMPAHSNAMLLSNPELSCGKRPPATYTGTEVGFSAMCPDNEETYRLVDDIVREIAGMTPGPYFHMGGDEVEALTREQYVRFVERVQEIVTKHGKRLVGWEEITKARLLPTSVAQQWHSDSARNALQSGAKLVMSPAKKVYLDMKYTANTELGLTWAAIIEIRDSYDWDPATYIMGVTEADIVGVEAPLWSETIRNITAAQYLAMPRLPSVAEVGWSPQSARRWEDFRVRLAAHAPRWRLLGINYYASPQIPW